MRKSRQVLPLEKQKHVQERFICLELNCKDMKLDVWGGWKLGKRHPQYGPAFRGSI